MSMFKRANREQLFARIALDGPPGSGKTFTGLTWAFALVGQHEAAAGRKVAVIDTEFRSASKYQGELHDDHCWDFDVCELEHFSPTAYTAAIEAAGRAGYACLLIDSLSHAWTGTGGALEQVDKKGANKFTDGWREVTPLHNAMIDAMLGFPGHLIITMRTKVEYVIEVNEKGKSVPRKIGLKPVQREGMEYEFDVIVDLDIDHLAKVSKSRCSALDGKAATKPDGEFVVPLKTWLSSGARRTEPPAKFVKGRQPGHEEEADTRTEVGPRERCTAEEARRIVELAKKIKMPAAALKAALAKRGVEKTTELTCSAAQKLIASLEAKFSNFEIPF